MKKYILSIDSGTTGITLLLIDKNLNVVEKYYLELTQYYPKTGWVEHDPIELINKIEKLLAQINSKYMVGLAAQRKTTCGAHHLERIGTKCLLVAYYQR